MRSSATRTAAPTNAGTQRRRAAAGRLGVVGPVAERNAARAGSAGAACAAFLWLLERMILLREGHLWLIGLLPLCGNSDGDQDDGDTHKNSDHQQPGG